jgi:hypothetical protein
MPPQPTGFNAAEQLTRDTEKERNYRAMGASISDSEESPKTEATWGQKG